jgi:hypothetical protein
VSIALLLAPCLDCLFHLAAVVRLDRPEEL